MALSLSLSPVLTEHDIRALAGAKSGEYKEIICIGERERSRAASVGGGACRGEYDDALR